MRKQGRERHCPSRHLIPFASSAALNIAFIIFRNFASLAPCLTTSARSLRMMVMIVSAISFGVAFAGMAGLDSGFATFFTALTAGFLGAGLVAFFAGAAVLDCLGFF